MEFNYFETLSKMFIIPTRQNQFIQENIFKNAADRQIAVAMNTISAFTGSYAKKPFWYQQFDLRQIGILRNGRPFVHFYVADNYRLCVTTI